MTFNIIAEVSVIFHKTACKCQNSRVKYCCSLFLLERTPNLSSTIIFSMFHKMSAVYVAVKNEQSYILTEIFLNFSACRLVKKIYLGLWRVSFHTSPSYDIVCNDPVT